MLVGVAYREQLLTQIDDIAAGENDEVVFLRVSDDMVSTLAPTTPHNVLSVFAARSLDLS